MWSLISIHCVHCGRFELIYNYEMLTVELGHKDPMTGVDVYTLAIPRRREGEEKYIFY